MNVLNGKFRKIGNDVIIAHAGRQPAKNIINGNPHVADARFSTPFARFDGDSLAIRFHGIESALKS